MCIITIYLYKIWPDLDLIDLYIIFVALHFGFSPFVRGLHFGKDVIFDIRNSNPLSIGLVFLQVMIILLIIRVVATVYLNRLTQYLKIRYLIHQWGDVNKYFLLIIYFCLILFQVFSYFKYGVTTYIMPDDFARIGNQLPYWFTSMRTMYLYIAFCVFLGLFANIVKSKGYQQYLWIILTIIFVPIVTLYGRRFFIAMIVTAVIFWFVYRKENIFRLRYIIVGLITICTLFIFSNLYQAYRFNIFITEGPVKWQQLENPFTAAFNFNYTINNLKDRPGTWEFNFLVIDNQLNKPGMIMNGNITWEHFKSAIPRFFWKNKQFSPIDETLAKLYNVKNIKEIDIGKNLFGIGQVDFGFFSIIIVPSVILLLCVILGSLIKVTIKYPTFLLLLSGNILFYLINIEENGNEIFLMVRYVLIILIFFVFYIAAKVIYETSSHKYSV
jgi:hypothetical protein